MVRLCLHSSELPSSKLIPVRSALTPANVNTQLLLRCPEQLESRFLTPQYGLEVSAFHKNLPQDQRLGHAWLRSPKHDALAGQSQYLCYLDSSDIVYIHTTQH